MRHAARAPALALMLMLMAGPASAETTLTGAIEQGGLVLGATIPGSAVSLDGRGVRVAADGRFVFGFGRDFGTKAVLTVRAPDGKIETRTLRVAPRQWKIQRIDGLPPAQVTPDTKALARIREEQKLVAARRDRDTAEPFFAGGFQQPANGPISGVFGSQRILNGEARAYHSGTDIAAPAGSPVTAAAAGMVSLAAPDLYFTGVTVMIDYGHGLSSVYAHMTDTSATEGQHVDRGQPIGHVGATGRATGPHLHWGVTWFDQRLDPETVLKVLPAAR